MKKGWCDSSNSTPCALCKRMTPHSKTFVEGGIQIEMAICQRCEDAKLDPTDKPTFLRTVKHILGLVRAIVDREKR